MQFITDGPDIPDELLQAHEDGRVVFFCGAGISYPAALPGFKGLVDQIYDQLGTVRTQIEEDAYKRGQYDATLDLLERRFPGGRKAVREKIVSILKPNLRLKGAMDTHRALLLLARNREDSLKLVTTNFDNIFQRIEEKTKKSYYSYAAPMLPIPKNSRWNGIVYLHGLLSNNSDESSLQRLILSSGDFGLAYLTERWAARFVSELFRNYIVCFVGYSINDPVLKYMMDALAADKMLGESIPQAYAFGDFENGQEKKKSIEWESKGVTPILYKVSSDGKDHSILHKTLKVWSEIYRDGITGRERIVVEYGLAAPGASTRQDDFVGRMLWALSHDSGLPAKLFSEINPAPSLGWLQKISEKRFKHSDLIRFGVRPNIDVDKLLNFSLIQRPSPYLLSQPMSLTFHSPSLGKVDLLMHHLGRWLTRHLNDPNLIHWIIENGNFLHESLSSVIDDKLNYLSSLEMSGNKEKLDEIAIESPNGIPSPYMRKLWRLLLSGRVKSISNKLDLYNWINSINNEGLTTTLRLQLRQLLSPVISLKPPFKVNDSELHFLDSGEKQSSIEWDLVLYSDHVNYIFKEKDGKKVLETHLSKLLIDFQILLNDALDLNCELSGSKVDYSHWALPSIFPHPQNREGRDWVILIELVRDAWLALLKEDFLYAKRIALEWFDSQYVTFKRLALFSASIDGFIPPEKWVGWLLSDSAHYLWSVETKRETMRLLVLQGNKLTGKVQERLEKEILDGPNRNMFKEDLNEDKFTGLVEHAVWMRLSKLKLSGLILGNKAQKKKDRLSNLHPQWQLAVNESDEFSIWMGGVEDAGNNFDREYNGSNFPRKRNDLVLWIRNETFNDDFHEFRDWRNICRTRFFHCLSALCDLSKENIWPISLWQVCFQIWSEDEFVSLSLKYAPLIIDNIPDEMLLELCPSLSGWIEKVSEKSTINNNLLLDMCERILNLQINPSAGIMSNGEPLNEPVTNAINHPVGKISQALIHIWFNREPSDNDTIYNDIKPLFEIICNTKIKSHIHGRVILAANLVSLFRVDKKWTVEQVFPLMDWEINEEEAKATWEGFLWSPRLYQPLLIELKSVLLQTANYYVHLGKHARQYSIFLTYVALNSFDGFTPKDFQIAISKLPIDGLSHVVTGMIQALDGAGEQREEYWKNRIYPFWRNIWPKSLDLMQDKIISGLIRLSISAKNEFPSALLAIKGWLIPISDLYYIIHLLINSELPKKYPLDVLMLLDAIIDENNFIAHDLGTCLNILVEACPDLLLDPRYQRLIEYNHKKGDYRN